MIPVIKFGRRDATLDRAAAGSSRGARVRRVGGIPDARGLTLLELLVVVAILAVLATVAIRSTSDFGQQARYDATRNTLNTFRDAVLGPANQITPDGTPYTTGFISDMGRPPRSVMTTQTFPVAGAWSVPDLYELYSGSLPSGLKSYSLYAASSGNVNNAYIVANTSTNSALLNDGALFVGAGWRGPYLSKSAMNPTYVDGWGKYLVSRNDLGTSTSAINTWPTMLLSVNTNQTFTLPEAPAYTAVINANWDVTGWFSQTGFEGAPTSSTDPYYGRFFSVISTNEYAVPITVTVNVNSSTFPTLGAAGNVVVLAMYGPNPAISASSPKPLQCTATVASYTQYNTSFVLSGANAPTIGTRVFRAWIKYAGGTSVTQSRTVYFPIRPGTSSVNIALP